MKQTRTQFSKSLGFILMLFVFLALQFCKTTEVSTKKNNDLKEESLISYSRDILPIMIQKCTPCHFPPYGKKKMLDTYFATKENIEDILTRVQLDENHKGFMPFKSKKEPMTESEINLLKKWISTGMSE